MRKFNTTGPVRPDRHYCIPPLERVDLEDVLSLVQDERYFVLHAPRQTGKTSTLLALREVVHKGLERTIREGVAQTVRYLERSAAESGHLVVFDRGAGSWDEKIFRREQQAGGRRIVVWGM